MRETPEQKIGRLEKEIADLERRLTQQQETTARWTKVVAELKPINSRLTRELEAERKAAGTDSLW